ncbi:MAG: sporulation protein YunB [Clostridia bacterium]|nr:sporulation protein YunB [Clostridia bacterium]
MRYHRCDKRLKPIFAVFFVSAAIVLTVLADIKLSGRASEICNIQIKHGISANINATVGETVGTQSDFAKISYTQDGKICGIQFDMPRISAVKSQIVSKINSGIYEGDFCTVKIPAGSLTGSSMLMGKGFPVTVKAQMYGTADAKIISEFSGCGINQTLHRILIEITADFYIVKPGKNDRLTVTTTYCLAETLIVGDIPSAYTLIEGASPDEIESRIIDFGAQVK